MRLLLAIIGYLCTATVIAAAAGFGYLWQSGRIDDEKAFRIVAIVHDVDLQKIEDERNEKPEVPAGEASLAEMARGRELLARDYEVKQEALRRGRQEFDHRLQKLTEATRRFEQTAQRVRVELEKQGEVSTKQAVDDVVRHLESVTPDVAKDLLLRVLNEPDGMTDVILLLDSMSPSKLKKVLQTFQSEEDLENLHAIHKLLLDGGPAADVLRQALGEINSLESVNP
ncbi:hypothetical protein Pla175_16020 [Pirellulimonas nuda]|uniref:MgtE intracellular N domain protein n=1 Tax=Pirellulimonas nuda TaxID=2528009 RepID=A0A518D9R4_9BACT|nr:hypothetical protein [Pirellulimonas nuda]QDU88229.1 hypothetical protein Pla175_16020 [Pirellulimonas nuda]